MPSNVSAAKATNSLIARLAAPPPSIIPPIPSLIAAIRKVGPRRGAAQVQRHGAILILTAHRPFGRSQRQSGHGAKASLGRRIAGEIVQDAQERGLHAPTVVRATG